MHSEIVSRLNSAVPGCNAVHEAREAGDDVIFVDPAHINMVCKTMKNCENHQFNVLQVITGTDYEDRIEVSYVLASFTKNLELILKTKLPKSSPDALVEIDSVCDVWKSANFQERECYDMLGVKFNNHPDLRRILCPYDDWQGYPLRKDYKVQKEWEGMEINPEHKVNSEDHFFFKKIEAEYGEDAKKVMHSWKGE